MKTDPAKEKEVWQPDEVELVGKTLAKTAKFGWMHTTFLMGYYQGIRVNQCRVPLNKINLTPGWESITYPDDIVKGGKGCTHPVVLTSEDVGSLGSVEQHAELQARARQNVVFEMGFSFGLLGQRRVCAIYDAGVEMPSDLGGILYVPYDVPAGKWRYDVAKEILAAGYDVDLNRL